MSYLKSPFFWFILAVLAAMVLAKIGPGEQSLGANIRIVYLHAAWAITAETVIALAAIAGLLGILSRRALYQRLSTALGRSGLFFWITYLPISLWAMQVNWNGMFLSEPRFRIAVIFSVSGVMLQMGLALLAKQFFTSLGNILFAAALWVGLSRAQYVMHPPPSPIFSSGIVTLELYFVGMLLFTLAAAYFMTCWWLQRQE